jgi:isoquinoline 1-oxidoreductase alpha subunit
MPLLWFLRDILDLTGTKYGCGKGLCGACTVHMDGNAIRSCSIPLSAIQGKEITTIEGLTNDGELHPVQQAWIEIDVPQCGYCQVGQIMSASALLAKNSSPDTQAIKKNVTNLCRCGMYSRIDKAIKRAAEIQRINQLAKEIT